MDKLPVCYGKGIAPYCPRDAEAENISTTRTEMRITSAVSVDVTLTGHRCITKTQIRQKKGLNAETAQNIAVIRTKKPEEYAKRRVYL